MEEKPKIGAPKKGDERKVQVSVSVPKKIVDKLTVQTIRKISTNIINMAYNQAVNKKD